MRAPIKKIFTFDPFKKNEERQIHQVQNLIWGEWTKELKENEEILDPVSGEVFLRVPNTTDFSEYIKNFDYKDEDLVMLQMLIDSTKDNYLNIMKSNPWNYSYKFLGTP